jgi:hypothetical protein
MGTPMTHITVRIGPRDLARLRARARAEGKCVSDFARDRLLEGQLDLSPLRALVGVIEDRAGAGKLSAPTMRALKDLSEQIGAALAEKLT